MPQNEMQELSPEPPSNSPPPQTQEGYHISIDVTPDGFLVTGPEPMHDAPEGAPNGEQVPDLPTALKHVIAIVRDNPLSGDAHEELKAGYDSA